MEGWGECVGGRGSVLQQRVDRERVADAHAYLVPCCSGRLASAGGSVLAYSQKSARTAWQKRALENALWDAEAAQKQQPLWKLLGGTRREIPCGVSIGIQDSVEQLLEKIAAELAAGYRRIKVKVKPGWDVNVLERIRSRWPDITLSCDANSAYTLDQVEHLRKFDQFNLLMIEQPLWNDDIYYHAACKKSFERQFAWMSRSSARAVLPPPWKPARAGSSISRWAGSEASVKPQVHDVCQSNSVPVWCGGMLETGIGRAQNIALSTLPNFSLPGDVSASKRYWKEDMIEPEVEVSPDGADDRNFRQAWHRLRY